MTRSRPLISLIAAVARHGAIGKGNALLCHISEDLKFFKRTTVSYTHLTLPTIYSV